MMLIHPIQWFSPSKDSILYYVLPLFLKWARTRRPSVLCDVCTCRSQVLSDCERAEGFSRNLRKPLGFRKQSGIKATPRQRQETENITAHITYQTYTLLTAIKQSTMCVHTRTQAKALVSARADKHFTVLDVLFNFLLKIMLQVILRKCTLTSGLCTQI